jgi:uncharacterized membrane protein YeaQ/YmgE (transglycosylase-associated protein family)
MGSIVDLVIMFAVGIVTGSIARFVMPGAQPMGLLKTGLLGVGGSVIAGLVFMLLDTGVVYQRGGFISSVIGAFVLLWAGKKFLNKSADK